MELLHSYPIFKKTICRRNSLTFSTSRLHFGPETLTLLEGEQILGGRKRRQVLAVRFYQRGSWTSLFLLQKLKSQTRFELVHGISHETF